MHLGDQGARPGRVSFGHRVPTSLGPAAPLWKTWGPWEQPRPGRERACLGHMARLLQGKAGSEEWPGGEGGSMQMGRRLQSPG